MRTIPAFAHWRKGSLAVVFLGNLVWLPTAAAQPWSREQQDIVAVAILDGGRAIVLATPGREVSGRFWRYRTFDTSALPQPLSKPVLSASGTKLVLRGPDGAAIVVDLSKQVRPNARYQYVDPRDLAINGAGGGHTHRLSARFVLGEGESGHLVDDLGGVRAESEAADGGTQALHPRSEAELRVTLTGDRLQSLRSEVVGSGASGSRPVDEWTFFPVAPDPELYVPVLEFVRSEEVFPSRFETLERLADVPAAPGVSLYDRYLRINREARRRNCAIYYRVRSLPGSWLIEYWLYYPFDIGGVHSHLHDPEHIFVEVDKLGGAVYKVIAAAHGFLAGNNIFSTTRSLAGRVALPLFAMVEFNKHASAPDIDRDGIFTPGIDENEYRERAKVWGVRDVIGTNNNHLIPYDRGMTLPRYEEDFLASVNVASRFPQETKLAARACCQLIPLPAEPPDITRCEEATTTCAVASVMLHPDYTNVTTILKDWVFPQSFLRATYALGPGLGLHSVGLGYSIDLDRTPGLGRVLPLPGRVGIEGFAWQQDPVAIAQYRDVTAGLEGRGVGFGFRYEQFLSNLFGIYSGVRIYSPPLSSVWVTFGPMVEVPLKNSGNVNFTAGLSFAAGGSPLFEMKVGVGWWKRRAVSVGMKASPPSQ